MTHLIHTCSDTNRDKRKMKPTNFLYLITCKAFDIHCLYTIKLECQMSSICAQLCNYNKQRYLNTSKKDNSILDFFVFLENYQFSQGERGFSLSVTWYFKKLAFFSRQAGALLKENIFLQQFIYRISVSSIK